MSIPVKTVNEYRCTREDLYVSGSAGYSAVGARQGYYVLANSESEALAKMKHDFPSDKQFTVELWKKNIQLFEY